MALDVHMQLHQVFLQVGQYYPSDLSSLDVAGGAPYAI